mgnify:CR=1 FL=1|jgi:hypothetical protein
MDLGDRSSHIDSKALWSPVEYAQLFALLTGGFLIPVSYEKSICLICLDPSSIFLFLLKAFGHSSVILSSNELLSVT